MRYSIITPVYNREDSISRCIESVNRNLTIGGGNFEHIIVDDGSSDDTVAIVEKYAQQYDHIKFIKFPHNRGTNAARNAAIAAAQGEWCIILDSDDYFVDNALDIVERTMIASPNYKHYMFAANDMQPYYESNAVIKGRKQCVLSYPDFLNEYVGGDFIHVCNTEILRRHPFDEQLRTHEGPFFLMFYRDAKEMLFTNEVITIRERNRADSTIREGFRTNTKVIERLVRHHSIMLAEFGNEMKLLGMNRRLAAIKMSLLDNLLLLGNYDEANKIYRDIKNYNTKKTRMLGCALHLRLGGLYRILIKLFLIAKYRIFKNRLQ